MKVTTDTKHAAKTFGYAVLFIPGWFTILILFLFGIASYGSFFLQLMSADYLQAIKDFFWGVFFCLCFLSIYRILDWLKKP